MNWQLLIYRLPSSPSRARVAAWRELRRLGALPLQQGVAAVPELGDLIARLDAVEARILQEDGVAYRFRLVDLAEGLDERLRREWNQLRSQEYLEIVEECETKFEREVAFELFRENLTAAEAEELEADLEKIRSWFARIAERDLFDAPSRNEAEAAIAGCERALEDFVERVYVAEQAAGPSLEPPADLAWGEGVPASKEERERQAERVVRFMDERLREPQKPKKAKRPKSARPRERKDDGRAEGGAA